MTQMSLTKQMNLWCHYNNNDNIISLPYLLCEWLQQDYAQKYFDQLCDYLEYSIETQIELICKCDPINEIIISNYEWSSDISSMQFNSKFVTLNGTVQDVFFVFAIMYCFYINPSKYVYQIQRGLFKNFILSVMLYVDHGSFSIGCPLNISAQIVLKKEEKYVDSFF